MNTENQQDAPAKEKLGVLWSRASIAGPLIGFVLYRMGLGMQQGTPDEPATWTQWQAGRIVFGIAMLFYMAALPCGIVALRRLSAGHARRKLAWWGTCIGVLALILTPIQVTRGIQAARARQARMAQAPAPQAPTTETVAGPLRIPPAIPTLNQELVEKAVPVVQARMTTEHTKFLAAVETFQRTNVLDLTTIRGREDYSARRQQLATFREAIREWRRAPSSAQDWFHEELHRLGAPKVYHADRLPDFARTYDKWGKEQRELCDLYDELALRMGRALGALESNWKPGQFQPGTNLPQLDDPQAREVARKDWSEIDGLRAQMDARTKTTNELGRAISPNRQASL